MWTIWEASRLSKTVYFETSDFYACTALIPKGMCVKPGVGISS